MLDDPLKNRMWHERVNYPEGGMCLVLSTYRKFKMNMKKSEKPVRTCKGSKSESCMERFLLCRE